MLAGYIDRLVKYRFVKYAFRFLRYRYPSKHFVCLQDVLKTSLRHVFNTSSRHVFKTSSRHVFKTSWRSLQHDNFSSDFFKTSWKTKNCYAKDVSKTKTCSTTKWCYPRLKSWQIALSMSIMKIQMIYTNTLEAPILICIKEMLQKTNCPTQKTA